MRQLTLLQLEEKPAPVPAWECVYRGAYGKCGNVYLHSASGWTVEHCGHPTANFPYLVVDADGYSHTNPLNGRGFQRLALAKSYVEQQTKGNE